MYSRLKEPHKALIDPQYLVEVKKGILALGDFFKVLDEKDIADIIPAIDIYSHISEHTKTALMKRMSLSEIVRLTLLLADKPRSGGRNAIIIRKDGTEITSKVKSYTVVAAVPKKSDWLQQAFANSDVETSKNSGGRITKAHMPAAAMIELTAFQAWKTAKRPALLVPENCKRMPMCS